MITTGTNQSKSFSDLLRPLRKNNQALPFFSVQFSSSICTVQSDNRGRRFRPTSAKDPTYFGPKMERKARIERKRLCPVRGKVESML